MENASKALLIAGGILIALLIISSAVYLYTQVSDYQKSEVAAEQQKEVVKFNNQFNAYINREDITLNEFISLYNRIESNNKKADQGYKGYYRIKHNMDKVYSNINQDFSKVAEDEKNNKYLFKCTKVEYKNPINEEV